MGSDRLRLIGVKLLHPSQDPEAATKIDEVWAKLVEGGEVLMPIDRYPFSGRYGWFKDKYGLSWQVNNKPTPAGIGLF